MTGVHQMWRKPFKTQSVMDPEEAYQRIRASFIDHRRDELSDEDIERLEAVARRWSQDIRILHALGNRRDGDRAGRYEPADYLGDR